MLDSSSPVFTDRDAAWEYYEGTQAVARMGGRSCFFINPRSYDGQDCPYCARQMRTHDDEGDPLSPNEPAFPTREHIVPRAQGGSDELMNLLVACRGCNELKEDLTLVEWRDLMQADRDPQAAILTALIDSDPLRFGRSGALRCESPP